MFVIKQSSHLKGTVTISWSKNAALPIIAANYLTKNTVKLTNVPHILDVERLHTIAENALKASEGKAFFDLTDPLCLKLRASILMLPYWLIHHGEVRFIGVGGCKLGKRSLDTFDDAFQQCWVELTRNDSLKIYKKTSLPHEKIILQEFSVTATEAILTYLSFLPDAQGKEFTIYQAAIEPHVLNLIDFLKNLGADIDVNYDHSITIKPQTIHIKSKECRITWDYLEAGMFLAIGALAKDSNITITWADMKDLLSVFSVCKNIGINYEIIDHQTFRVDSKNVANYHATKIQTMIFPWFPTDLQSVFATLLTQAQWVSKIFETLFEGRFAYLAELENLGAKVEILNPHQAVVIWPHTLHGNYVTSTDIRWWGALLVAGVIASGETVITNEELILRWYEDIVKKLQSIGVQIEKKDS